VQNRKIHEEENRLVIVRGKTRTTNRHKRISWDKQENILKWNSSMVYNSEYTKKFLIASFFFFGGTGIWTPDFALTKQGLNCLSHASSPFLLWLFWRWGSLQLFAQPSHKSQSSDLSLPSSYNYKCELPTLSLNTIL
jgi:hypothetical protein